MLPSAGCRHCVRCHCRRQLVHLLRWSDPNIHPPIHQWAHQLLERSYSFIALLIRLSSETMNACLCSRHLSPGYMTDVAEFKLIIQDKDTSGDCTTTSFVHPCIFLEYGPPTKLQFVASWNGSLKTQCWSCLCCSPYCQVHQRPMRSKWRHLGNAKRMKFLNVYSENPSVAVWKDFHSK